MSLAVKLDHGGDSFGSFRSCCLNAWVSAWSLARESSLSAMRSSCLSAPDNKVTYTARDENAMRISHPIIMGWMELRVGWEGGT